MTEKPQPLDLGKIKKEVLDEYCGGIPFDEIEEFQLEPEQIEKIIEITIYRIKQRIKSACEFYLRYKDNPELLVREHPEYKEKIEEIKKEFISVIKNIKQSLIPDVIRGIALSIKYELYNEWLFKLTFRGVLDD